MTQTEGKKLTLGILAHVDAGKTTLTEALLYLGGVLKKPGRVDHQTAFLDTDALERQRGITIFAKQALLPLPKAEITLLDTPGHVDFSSEMERTLAVLDYAVLVISGTDGIQGHTLTLWRLLARQKIPVFLFINKTDLPGTERTALLTELKKRLDSGCVDFSRFRQEEAFQESLAMAGEAALEEYLSQGQVSEGEIISLIAERKVFPCYFGSALHLQGVEELLKGLAQYSRRPSYPEEFGARIFKIARDPQGNRLTFMKITGGVLKVKTLLTNRRAGLAAEQLWEEKADQIRIYSGEKYEITEQAAAGTVCAVTGLSKTRPGQGLGWESAWITPFLEPVLTYRLKTAARLRSSQRFFEACPAGRGRSPASPFLEPASEGNSASAYGRGTAGNFKGIDFSAFWT